MPAPQPGVWGIDIGQCALKALRLQLVDGEVTATAFDYIEHPKLLNQPEAEPEELVREALQKFLERNKTKGDLIAVSVPGQAGLARFVKLPPVEEKKIPDIVKFEAKQQIPFNLDEVVWDYQKIGSGTVTDGFAMETEIGLFAIKRETVEKFLGQFRDVNVEVHFVQMAPLALCNFVTYDLLGKDATPPEDGEGSKECLVALDVGTESSNLVITDGERTIWQRPIPYGGNHFTRALIKDLKLSFAKAEHLKRNATKSPDLKKILASLKPVLNDFVNEVQRSLGFFANTHRDATVQYVAALGNAFRLPGMQKYLSEKLGLEVRKLQKFERLRGEGVVTAPAFTENLMTFGTAYGLALQGLQQTRLHTNLLPKEIHVARQIRAKKPMAAAAAAVLLLGVGALTLGYSREHRSVAAPVIQDAMREGRNVLTEANEWKSRCERRVAAINELQNAIESVLAGQDERKNWLQLHKYINDCLPGPDDSQLTEEQKRAYWDNGGATPNDPVEGRLAYEKFRKRQAGLADAKEEDDGIEALIHVNLEAVNCLFSDDLNAVFTRGRFFTTLRESGRGSDTIGMREPLTQPPSGKGWVVELRGYTYHKKTRQFLTDTLMANLATRAGPRKTAPPPQAAPANPSVPAEKEMKDDDAIKGRISHVFLYAYNPVRNPDPARFELIHRSYLRDLIAGGKFEEPGTMPGTGLPPGTQSLDLGLDRSRNRWKPVGGVGTAPSRPADDQGGANSPSETTTPRADIEVKKGQIVRTEFVIMFVWDEPTPSDKYVQSGKLPATDANPPATGGR
ncbi:MAG: type IV pilus assembly protein PilM [Gemmataceae bacterium]|nr:type IV pilus assembly protein PilM [Gemmataceae bacterium]MDW8265914.1 type IV pilus assembly protein PilM [Gemmataceae bacterium]